MIVSSSPAPQRNAAARPGGRLEAVTNSTGYDYLLALPERYSARAPRRWPLLLFLHGAAQRGANVAAVAEQGLPRLLTDPAALSPKEQSVARLIARSFIVLAPQCPQLEVWEEPAVLDVLEQVSRSFSVDPRRVYLTGLSMGGFGAWAFAVRNPERFAALLPVCGGGRLADVAATRGRRRQALRTLPIWAFHGARDRVVPLEESKRMIAGLQRIDARDVRLTVYPDAEHDAWTATYANPAVYRWLLKQQR